MPVVTGYIDPIPAASLLNLGDLVETPPPPPGGVQSRVPILYPHIHRVQLKPRAPGEPLQVEDDSITYARGVAERIVGGMEHLPHTTEAGELLALAFAVLHFTGARR